MCRSAADREAELQRFIGPLASTPRLHVFRPRTVEDSTSAGEDDSAGDDQAKVYAITSNVEEEAHANRQKGHPAEEAKDDQDDAQYDVLSPTPPQDPSNAGSVAVNQIEPAWTRGHCLWIQKATTRTTFHDRVHAWLVNRVR
jgi:hypothetical protein